MTTLQMLESEIESNNQILLSGGVIPQESIDYQRELMAQAWAEYRVATQEVSGPCPAPSHFSPSDDRYNTRLITTADCGWCGEPVVVRG